MSGPIERHITELAAKTPAYRELAAMEDTGHRAEAAKLLDFLLSNQLDVPAGFGTPPDAQRWLLKAVEAAHPDRRCIGYFLPRVPQWLGRLEGAARTEFLEQLPVLAPALFDLADDGIADLLEAGSHQPKLFATVSAYSMTTREAIRTFARFALRAVNTHSVGTLQRFTATFTPLDMEKSRDAEHLPARLGTAAANVCDADFANFLDLAYELASRDVSSANGVMKDLPGSLRIAQHTGAYLESFRALVRALGTRAAGASLNLLPRWYADKGVEPVNAFVAAVCETAASYGVNAGEALLDRRTTAAKELMP